MEVTDAERRTQDRQIDPSDIQGEYTRVPGQIGYWGEQYARALSDCRAADDDVDYQTALAVETLRGTATKGTTETALKQQALLSSPVQGALRQQRAAHAGKNLLYTHFEAMKAKAECLVSLGAQIRAELKHLDPTTRTA